MTNDTVSSLSWGFLFASMGMGVFFFIPIFANMLTESRTAIGSLFSLTSVITVITQPFFGRFSDRTQKRRIFIVWGIFLSGVLYFGYPFAGTILILLVFRSVQGLTTSIYTPVAPALIADVTAPAERGQAMGKWNKYSSVGILMGVLTCGIIAYLTGDVTSVFYFAGVMFVLSALLLQMRLRDPNYAVSRAMSKGSSPHLSKNNASEIKLNLRQVYLFSMVNTIIMIGAGAVYPFLSIYMQTALQANMLLIGAYYFVDYGAQSLFFQPFGNFSDKIGRKPIILLGTLLYVLVFAGYAIVNNHYLFFLVCMLNGTKWAAFYSAGLAWVSDMAPEESHGRELGYYSGAQSAGWIIGPVLGGFLADVYGLQITFALVIIFPVIGFFLLLLLKETRKSEATLDAWL